MADQPFISPQLVSAGGAPYVHVDNEVVGDLSATWTSSSGKYSVTGYVRNIGDNQYKTYVNEQSVSPPPPSVTTTLYDPRTYGLILSATL
jgi:iron complex outermembrane receptor protein